MFDADNESEERRKSPLRQRRYVIQMKRKIIVSCFVAKAMTQRLMSSAMLSGFVTQKKNLYHRKKQNEPIATVVVDYTLMGASYDFCRK